MHAWPLCTVSQGCIVVRFCSVFGLLPPCVTSRTAGGSLPARPSLGGRGRASVAHLDAPWEEGGGSLPLSDGGREGGCVGDPGSLCPPRTAKKHCFTCVLLLIFVAARALPPCPLLASGACSGNAYSRQKSERLGRRGVPLSFSLSVSPGVAAKGAELGRSRISWEHLTVYVASFPPCVAAPVCEFAVRRPRRAAKLALAVLPRLHFFYRWTHLQCSPWAPARLP
jgi:hypothetical protein